MKTKAEEGLRRIPSMEKILTSETATPLVTRYGREPVKRAASDVLTAIRSRGADPGALKIESILEEAGAALKLEHAPSLLPLINASGVIIHTNLGRSPVTQAISRKAERLFAYSNLEFDLASGGRGRREHHLSSVCARVFGAEAAVLTNNNAAATLLLLAAVANGREVVVSRGELVEIGGSFRVPDVIQQGGARLKEVGTTNRTRASDYDSAVSRKTAALLRVHRSNFEITGFTEMPEVADLVAVARKRKIPMLMDEGSGRVVDISRYGFRSEATVRQLLEAGVDAVTSSTDKLIGATQGGLILGSRAIVDRCRSHPLMRALRAGKESYAIIGATLEAFATGRHEEEVGIYQALARSLESLKLRAEAIALLTGASVVESRCALGGGTTPSETIPSIAVSPQGDAARLQRSFLALERPIVGRILDDRLLLDLRTVEIDDDEYIAACIKANQEVGSRK